MTSWRSPTTGSSSVCASRRTRRFAGASTSTGSPPSRAATSESSSCPYSTKESARRGSSSPRGANTRRSLKSCVRQWPVPRGRAPGAGHAPRVRGGAHGAGVPGDAWMRGRSFRGRGFESEVRRRRAVFANRRRALPASGADGAVDGGGGAGWGCTRGWHVTGPTRGADTKGVPTTTAAR